MNKGLSGALRAYVTAVVIAGSAPLAWAVVSVAVQPPHVALILLAAVSVLGGPLAIRIPSMKATISVCEGFVFAAGLLFGPAPATLIAVIDGLAVSLWSRDRRLYRTLFNITEPAISVTISVLLFYRLSGAEPLLNQTVAFAPLIVPLLVLTISYFGLNTMLAAGAMWLETGTPPLTLLRRHFSHVVLDFCVSLSLASVMVQMSGNLTVAAIVVLVPMLLASYLSSHYVAGRLEDANHHLEELSRLHQSTIETLAMAIDAKDQVTHGHIRRVQSLSTRLALILGASEEELRALEAAALLHDLGKLAVPEHILNKPGPLTPAEFRQIQEHAQVGASILSSIEFPYPVAPIVRHHHENWDGSGYPDGLRGEAIPLGARILAVVDCYDALTSDRPYRRRMSEGDAMAIILNRSGRMYDPRIVEAFLTVYHAVPAEMDLVDRTADNLLDSLRFAKLIDPPTSPTRTPSPRREIPDGAGSVRAHLGRLHEPHLPDLAIAASRLICHTMPDSVVAVYRYDEQSDELVSCDVEVLLDPTIPERVRLGHGVSGWVGANRQTMSNCDAALDLGERCLTPPPLRLCTSAPMLNEGKLAGVLTVYSPYAFSEIDRLLVEALALELGSLLPAATRRTTDGSIPPPLVVRGSAQIN